MKWKMIDLPRPKDATHENLKYGALLKELDYKFAIQY